ncbi:hypothetical protein C8R44DRAFT_797579 [Mycena epipterygia]|nr:hypothetical protein C8R44DRAFT_797579 [Mycena epipterygia]
MTSLRPSIGPNWRALTVVGSVSVLAVPDEPPPRKSPTRHSMPLPRNPSSKLARLRAATPLVVGSSRAAGTGAESPGAEAAMRVRAMIVDGVNMFKGAD